MPYGGAGTWDGRICAILPARVAVALYWTGPAGAVATVGFVRAPVPLHGPRERVLGARHQSWPLGCCSRS
ncbi:MAG: hypothetical protein ACRDZO_05070 [Egibacteraceae bacterium]